MCKKYAQESVRNKSMRKKLTSKNYAQKYAQKNVRNKSMRKKLHKKVCAIKVYLSSKKYVKKRYEQKIRSRKCAQ